MVVWALMFLVRMNESLSFVPGVSILIRSGHEELVTSLYILRVMST